MPPVLDRTLWTEVRGRSNSWPIWWSAQPAFQRSTSTPFACRCDRSWPVDSSATLPPLRRIIVCCIDRLNSLSVCDGRDTARTATMRIIPVTLRNALGNTQPSRRRQIAFHQRRVSIRVARPMTPVATVASLAPNASAAKPMPMNPIGPVPMHTERMPSTRPRISAGALI